MKKFVSLFASIAIAIILISNIVIVAQNGVEQPDMTIDAKIRAEVIENVLKNLNDSYVFPDVAKRMEADVRNRLKNKEYDKIRSAKVFAKKLTSDLQSVSRDKHLEIYYSAQPIPVRKEIRQPTAEEIKEEQDFMKLINWGFEKVERLPGNIGYIKQDGFYPSEGGEETVAAAMNFVHNTGALIFDLRENGGGEPGMVGLISSYLFGDKPVHLNDLYWREGSRTEEFWTNPKVLGKKYVDKDVYILTSNDTFSAAEEFSNNLKVLKRATIIGEPTGGGAHPGAIFRITKNFEAFISIGRAVNPITKTNWEGTGVKPDVEVPAKLALKTAYLTALKKSLEKAKNEDLKGTLKQIIEKTQKELTEESKKAKVKRQK